MKTIEVQHDYQTIYVKEFAPMKVHHYFLDIVLIILLLSTTAFAILAVRNAKPLCDDITMAQPDKSNLYNPELVCEVGLGNVTPEQARHEVIMVDNK